MWGYFYDDLNCLIELGLVEVGWSNLREIFEGINFEIIFKDVLMNGLGWVGF